MNIVIISPVIDRYGAGNTLRGIVRNLITEGHSVTLVIPEGVSSPEDIHEYNLINVIVEKVNFPVIRRSSLRFPRILFWLLHTVHSILRLRRKLIGILEGADVVHLYTSATLLAGFPLRGKTLMTVSLHEVPRNILEKKSVQLFIKYFQANTVGASRFILDAFDLNDCEVIYSGVDLNRFGNVTPCQFSQDGVLRVICVGRFNNWKGQDLLIDSLRLLAANNVAFRADFYGSGFGGDFSWLNAAKDRVESLRLQQCISFKGELSNIESVLEGYDVSVVPSKRPEPFGKVVVEGMASGLIVIASNHGGPAEVITDGVNGFLFAPNDSENLAFILERISAMPLNLKKTIGLNASKTAKEYSEGDAAKAYRSFLSRSVGEAQCREN